MTMTDQAKEEKSESAAPLLERLNNDEFREYLPHMELEEALCTEIYNNEKWVNLLNVFTKTKTSVTCHVCKEKLSYEQVKEHMRCATHLESLKNVAQFYHPAYTYFRGAKDLMNGKKVSKEELHKAIELANGGLSKLTDKVDSYYNKYVQKVELEKAMRNPDFEETLKKVVLNTESKSPKHIYAVAHLPLLTLLSVEYSVEKNIWKPMLTNDRQSFTAAFECNLCNVSCRGIRSVNDHCTGTIHTTNQLKTLGVRCSEFDFLTKNCIYRYNVNFSLYIKDDGKIYFKKKVEEILKKNGGLEKESDDKNKESVLPELEESVKAKAKLLKLQIKEFEANKKNESMKLEKSSVESQTATSKENIDNSGLMGVEYVVRIIKSFDNTKNEYECVLCEHVAKESRMAEHLVSHMHRLKYMELHYPDAMTRYKNNIGHMKYPSFIRVIGIVLAKVALALEKHHGYGAVRDVLHSQYTKNRSQVVSEIYSQPHASHEHGPSFSNVVSTEEIRRYIKQTKISVLNVVEHSTPERFSKASNKKYNECGGPQKEHKGRTERVRSRSPKDRTRGHGDSSRKRSHTRSARQSRHHDNTHDIKSKADIWELYRKEVSKAAIEIENKYMDYRQRPETHPLYNKEWNIFWKNRKEDLMAQGVDHRGYNFQPEWGNFFKKRIEIFFSEALQKSQIEIRRRLNIPLDAEEDAQDGSKYGSREKRRRLDMNAGMAQWSDPAGSLDYRSTGNQPPIIAAAPIVDNKPNVIHVLRLLTAFEEHLGSLGPKIVELLSKALSLEKHFGDNFIALEAKILTGDNCSLIETAVEKLKGVLFAGLLNNSKEQSFNRVLQSTANLLKHAEKMGYLSAQNYDPIANNSVANSNDLNKFLNALQNQKGNTGVSNQKSLSDTLMSLIDDKNATSPSNGRVNPKQYDAYGDNMRNNQQRYQRGGGGGIGNNQQSHYHERNDRYHQKQQQQGGIMHQNKAKNNKQMGNNGNMMEGLLNFDTKLNRSRNTVNSYKEFPDIDDMTMNARNLVSPITSGGSNYTSNFNNYNPRGVNAMGNRNMNPQ